MRSFVCVSLLAMLVAGCGNRPLDPTARNDGGLVDTTVKDVPRDVSTEPDLVATCDELAGNAQQEIVRFVMENAACQDDADCTIVKDLGGCIGACYLPLEKGAVTALRAKADSLCEAFDAQQCFPRDHPCLAPLPVRCKAGACAMAP